MGLFPKILAAPEVNPNGDPCPMSGNCYAFTPCGWRHTCNPNGSYVPGCTYYS